MRVSFNQVRKYTDIKLSDDELVQKIGAQIGAVEEVIEFGKKFEGVLIAKVISCDKHPNADRLSVCLVDDGGKAANVQRDQNGKVIVVCGAPNVKAGMTVAWLPPGSTVPSTYAKEPLVLDARELRGVVSNGMIASGKELGLSDDHDGILEITDNHMPGTSFAKAYGLDGDIVIDIENKMFTHRPDCFGYLGIAREVAGIQGVEFKSPGWYSEDAETPGGDGLKLEVVNEIPELVPRFCAITMSDVKVGKSPVWLQIELARAGIRSINNIVDMTNYLMVLTGQPLHAYDYDKVKGSAPTAKIIVRKPKPGEKIKLLNGKEIEPRARAAMIATPEKLIGIGGVMGGADTEVSDGTTNIIFEAANFDMFSVRRSSMEHGLFTDAVTRFSKGQSPLQTNAVLVKAVEYAAELSGAKTAGNLIDEHPNPAKVQTVNATGNFINARLGLKLEAGQIAQLLKNVEFEVQVKDDSLQVTAPFWRTDISIAEDIVEEVGRLYGYEKLPLDLPSRSTIPSKPDEILQFKSRIRSRLASLGGNEVLNYSFVHGKLLKRTGQSVELAFKLSNALSPDLQYYRMSLVPSLLSNVHPNIKAGFDSFALFELGKLHNKNHKDDDGGVPKEFENLGFVFSGKSVKPGEAYYSARNYLDELAASLGIKIEYRSIEKEAGLPVVQPFDHKRSALAFDSTTNIALGIVGELKSLVRQQFKLPPGTAAFEVGINELMASSIGNKKYMPISRYPSISQDVCLQVAERITYAELMAKLRDSINSGLSDAESAVIEPIDIYSSEKIQGMKRITFHVKLTSHKRTLTEDYLTNLIGKAGGQLASELGAEQI